MLLCIRCGKIASASGAPKKFRAVLTLTVLLGEQSSATISHIGGLVWPCRVQVAPDRDEAGGR